MSDDQDQAQFERFVRAFEEATPDQERDHLDDLEGTFRLRERRQSLFVNCTTGEMVSAHGRIPDGAVEGLEQFHREQFDMYRALLNDNERPPAS